MGDIISDYLSRLDMDALRRQGEAQQRQETLHRDIRLLPIDNLREMPEEAQCFRPADEARLKVLTESICRNGVLSLLIVRPLEDGAYEIIAGRNRRRAAMQLGYIELPCLIKHIDDAAAIDLQITDNLLHRESILPSEKAKAYKMRLDGIKRQGARYDLTCDHNGHKLKAVEMIAADSPDSKTQIQRYIRLNYLLPELLEMVDGGRLGLVVGATVSHLSEATQMLLSEYLQSHPKVKLSPTAAETLRTAEREDASAIDEALLEKLLSEQQRQRAPRIVRLQMRPIRQFFPKDANAEEISETIQKALQFYFAHQQ